MALNPKSYLHIGHLGISRLIDASGGRPGPNSVVSYHLVPANGFHNGQRLPHDVYEDLKKQSYDKRTIEGIEYFLVPETSTNIPGTLSHYAQRTGVAELQNPPSGGVNRVRETLADYHDTTVDPEGVKKYVDDNDAYEEARQKQSFEDDRLARAVSKSPAREPAEGKLVADKNAKPAEGVKSSKPEATPKTSS